MVFLLCKASASTLIGASLAAAAASLSQSAFWSLAVSELTELTLLDGAEAGSGSEVGGGSLSSHGILKDAGKKAEPGREVGRDRGTAESGSGGHEVGGGEVIGEKVARQGKPKSMGGPGTSLGICSEDSVGLRCGLGVEKIALGWPGRCISVASVSSA